LLPQLRGGGREGGGGRRRRREEGGGLGRKLQVWWKGWW